MLSIHLVLFLAFGAVAVAGAVNLLVQRHPINGALSLIAVMAALAGEYLLLGAEFVAAIQVIVYAGAIMVLFVFTIMLLNAGRKNEPGVAAWPHCSESLGCCWGACSWRGSWCGIRGPRTFQLEFGLTGSQGFPHGLFPVLLTPSAPCSFMSSCCHLRLRRS